MDIGDAFRILALTPRASAREAKSAYRRLAMECHPDRLQAQPKHVLEEAEEKMKTLNAAYGVVIRYLTGLRGEPSTPKPRRRGPTARKPWWWQEAPPPASDGAVRRPAWFRGFSWEDPSFMRDTLADYVGAIVMALWGMCFLVVALGAFRSSVATGTIFLLAGLITLHDAYDAVRD